MQNVKARIRNIQLGSKIHSILKKADLNFLKLHSNRILAFIQETKDAIAINSIIYIYYT